MVGMPFNVAFIFKKMKGVNPVVILRLVEILNLSPVLKIYFDWVDYSWPSVA
jgi:hypothetical protein